MFEFFNRFKKPQTHTQKIHHRLKEMFTGRRNLFTVTLAFIGIYFFTYPLANIIVGKIGYEATTFMGLIILLFSSYILDTYHKEK